MEYKCTACGNMTNVVGRDSKNNPYCPTCCGMFESETMVITGKAVLYLTSKVVDVPEYHRIGLDAAHKKTVYEVSNWFSTLNFEVKASWAGNHNWGHRVLYVRFIGPDGCVWSGKHHDTGSSQLVYCKRTKYTHIYEGI